MGLHHGRSLRGWCWPADARLTPEGARGLVDWLAARGVDHPRREWEEGVAAEAAARRRLARVRALLPGKVRDALDSAGDPGGLAAAFKKGLPDPVERAAAAFRIYGCDWSSWNISQDFDGIVGELLEDLDPAILSQAARKAAGDPMGLNGVARRLFSEKEHWKEVDAGTGLDLLPAAAAHGLTHPRDINRRRTLNALAGIRAETSLRLLRDVLSGALRPRPLPAGEEGEPRGMASFSRIDWGEGSDRAHAAILLARRGDRESEAAIRDLAAKSADKDREVLERALSVLKNPEESVPGTSMGFYERGTARLERAFWEGAAGDFSSAVDIRPDFAEAHEARGLARALLKDARALADLAKAEELAPGRPRVRPYRSLALALLERDDEALEEADAALAADPNGAFYAHAARGIVRLRRGRKEEALATFESFLRAAKLSDPLLPVVECLLRQARERDR